MDEGRVVFCPECYSTDTEPCGMIGYDGREWYACNVCNVQFPPDRDCATCQRQESSKFCGYCRVKHPEKPFTHYRSKEVNSPNGN